MLKVDNISVSYGDGRVLSNVSFAIEPGDLLAVIGPNGAGKTSLLRAINGAVKPDNGEIRLFDRLLGDYSRPEISREVTVVAQENETKFPMTVRAFVLAGRFAHGSAFGWESEKDIGISEKCLDECGLQGFSERLMNELSGGERQRVLLARAFATEARMLLLDEPTNNLDLSNQALMLKLVRKRCDEKGAGALVITHDLNLVSSFSDRVIILSEGEIAAEGTPEEVLTEANIAEVFEIKVLRDINPHTGRIRVTPLY